MAAPFRAHGAPIAKCVERRLRSLWRNTVGFVYLTQFYFFLNERNNPKGKKSSTVNIVCGHLEPALSSCFREMSGVIRFLCAVAARLTFYILSQMSLFVNVTSSYQSIMHRVERAKPNCKDVSTL